MTIRPLNAGDLDFLRDMSYQALYVPPGCAPFPKEIMERREIARYTCDWPRESDMGFVAVEQQGPTPIGAAWLRLFTQQNPGYGYVNDETPELSIALLPAYRGKGIGTSLMRQLIEAAGLRYRGISLSVAKENPAGRLYRRLGFQVFSESEDTLIMVKNLSGNP